MPSDVVPDGWATNDLSGRFSRPQARVWFGSPPQTLEWFGDGESGTLGHR